MFTPVNGTHDMGLAVQDSGSSTAKRLPVSAFIVAFNEEDDIAACIHSLAFCDEVVVVDSFSTDRTREICESLGARVYERAWPGYREQKAFGLQAVQHNWVINLDADERVSPELRENILEILAQEYRRETEGDAKLPAPCSGYEMNRVVYFLGRWWRHGGWYPEYRVRFLRRDRTVWGGTDPHEKPIVEGRIGRLEGELQHYTYKNLSEQFDQLHRFATIAAEQDYRRGKRASLVRLLLNPLLRMIKFYLIKRGYREGIAGLVVAVAEGFYTFMKYAKLWELKHAEALSQSFAARDLASGTTSKAINEN
jgi:glycosyltransferase involved in cell wall biosynthesis